MAAIRRDPARAIVALAMLAAAAIYLPTVGRGLVDLDDPWLVRDNWIVRDPSWASLHSIWFAFDATHRVVLGAEYLPIRDLSVMLDHAVWGDWYGGAHLVNVGIYIATIPLWFAALVRFGIDRRACAIAVLLWAVQPSHAESVAWLAERKGVLGMLFAGGCAYAYARFRSGDARRWLAIAIGCAVCAVWSKALAAFAIAALGGIELVAPAARVSWRRSAFALASIGVVALLAFIPVVWTARSLDVVGGDVQAPVGPIAMAIGTFGFYLRLGIGSIPDAVSYAFATAGPSAIDYAFGVVGLAACIAAFAWLRGPWRVAAVLWLVGWFPISHLVLPVRQIVVADRYALFPTLGLALAIALGAMHVSRPYLRAGLCAVIALAFVARAVDAQGNWRDSAALWERAVASNPSDGDAWNMYAEALVERGDADAAARAVATGLELTHAPRLVHRAALLALAAGDRPRAMQLFAQAAAGGEPRAMTNLALELARDGDRTTALAWARKAVALRPAYANGLRILGKIALSDGQPAEALAAFTRAYELEPDVAANRFNLGLALLALHRTAEARVQLETCLSDPVLADQARALLR